MQARAGSIPTMKDMIAPPRQRLQWRLHLAACALLGVSVFWPAAAPAAGGALTLSAGSLWVNLFSAVRRFRAHGGRLG